MIHVPSWQGLSACPFEEATEKRRCPFRYLQRCFPSAFCSKGPTLLPPPPLQAGNRRLRAVSTWGVIVNSLTMDHKLNLQSRGKLFSPPLVTAARAFSVLSFITRQAAKVTATQLCGSARQSVSTVLLREIETTVLTQPASF